MVRSVAPLRAEMQPQHWLQSIASSWLGGESARSHFQGFWVTLSLHASLWVGLLLSFPCQQGFQRNRCWLTDGKCIYKAWYLPLCMSEAFLIYRGCHPGRRPMKPFWSQLKALQLPSTPTLPSWISDLLLQSEGYWMSLMSPTIWGCAWSSP